MYMLIMLMALAGQGTTIQAYPRIIPTEAECKAALVASEKEVGNLAAEAKAEVKTEFRCVKLD